MKEYKNFYEDIKEARKRVDNTVVMYDKVPHYVLCTTDHKSDGIFRVYMEPLGEDMVVNKHEIPCNAYEGNTEVIGAQMDTFLNTPNSNGIIRKHMNSPLFDRFRPFPLGMCNHHGKTLYTQRQPSRHTQQGLTASGLIVVNINTDINNKPQGINGNTFFFSNGFRDTINGTYMSGQECMENLLNPEIGNVSAAFHRDFAFCRGPMGLLFLNYKGEMIGYLTKDVKDTITLGSEFKYTKEAVSELGLFTEIK